MAINPKRVAFQVALRSTQLIGDDQTELEASYTATNLTTLDGKEVPVSALKDVVVAIEAELHELIGNEMNHPYRSLIESDSVDLASGDNVPEKDAANVEFIGILSGVFDSTDDLPLTEGALQEIFRYSRASTGRYTADIRKFKFDCGKIYHTKTNVVVRGCIFDRAAAIGRLANAATGLSPLPTSLESLWIARCLQFLASEGWFIPEAQYYGGFAETCIQRLKNRETDIPSLPSQVNTARPVQS